LRFSVVLVLARRAIHSLSLHPALPVLFVAVSLHEIRHGVVALFYGDDTAKRAGRLTLNPVPHIAPMGSMWGTGFSVSRPARLAADRKSTRLNSSHGSISYAALCVKQTN